MPPNSGEPATKITFWTDSSLRSGAAGMCAAHPSYLNSAPTLPQERTPGDGRRASDLFLGLVPLFVVHDRRPFLFEIPVHIVVLVVTLLTRLVEGVDAAGLLH